MTSRKRIDFFIGYMAGAKIKKNGHMIMAVLI
jgi:hypothetical protein